MRIKSEIHARDRVFPEKAVVILRGDFERFAAHLRRCDISLRDDLIQEMNLGVLQCREPHTLSYFKSRGVSRAKDFLRMWTRHAMFDLNEISEEPIDQSLENNAIRDLVLERVAALVGE